MHICCVHTWIRFWANAHRVNPPQEVNWNWIATEFTVYSSNNNKITHGYAPMNSNIIEAFASIRHPRYELWWPIMLGHYWLDSVKKETAYQVILCSSSKFTFHVVYYQRQGKANNWTDFSVCFDTSRMLESQGRNRYFGCSECGMPTAIQLQFGFKILAVWTRSMWIEFAFDAHWVNANSIHIQTGSSVKRP